MGGIRNAGAYQASGGAFILEVSLRERSVVCSLRFRYDSSPATGAVSPLRTFLHFRPRDLGGLEGASLESDLPMFDTNDSIVITGMGLASPIGLSAREAIERLLRGETGVAPGDGEQVFARAAVPRYELTGLRMAKNQKFLSAGARHLMWAGLRALEQSEWSSGAVPPERMAVFTGSGQVGLEPSLLFPGFDAVQTPDGEGDWAAVGGPASRSLDIYFPLRTLSNSGLALLAMEMGARGPSNNFVQSDTAAIMALESAIDALLANECDLAVCGTYENLLSPANFLNFREAGLLTEPPIRPFDRDAGGTVIGEAGAALVLERKASARARGATILGEIAGVATAMDDVDRMEPVSSGAAVRSTIGRVLGECPPDFVVLSGVGVRDYDRVEAAAVASALPTTARVPCTAFKGSTGYLGGATALVEIALAIAALHTRQVPPVTGLVTPADGIGLDLVIAQPRALSDDKPLNALCVSHSLLGQSAAVRLCYQVH